ncbi:unnamed protein product, partial [Ectocarpus sp. 12 AP-2014]
LACKTCTAIARARENCTRTAHEATLTHALRDQCNGLANGVTATEEYDASGRQPLRRHQARRSHLLRTSLGCGWAVCTGRSLVVRRRYTCYKRPPLARQP